MHSFSSETMCQNRIDFHRGKITTKKGEGCETQSVVIKLFWLLPWSILALNLAVTSVGHTNTVPILASELAVIAGTHRHLPAVSGPAVVVGHRPSPGPQQQGARCRLTLRVETFSLTATSYPSRASLVIPGNNLNNLNWYIINISVWTKWLWFFRHIETSDPYWT